MAHSGKQNRDEALILALASGLNVRDAAKQCGVGYRTAHRRLEDLAFRNRIADVRAKIFDQAVGRLADAATKAIDTLLELLDEESARIRLGAARSILEFGPRMNEALTLEQRMREVEESLQSKGLDR